MRILNGGTEATTRVLIESRDGKGNRWSTVGVSPNIVDASFQALSDSIIYKLVREGVTAVTAGMRGGHGPMPRSRVCGSRAARLNGPDARHADRRPADPYLTAAEKGVMLAVMAHLIWGGMAVYFGLMRHISPVEIAVNRGLWSLPIAVAMVW